MNYAYNFSEICSLVPFTVLLQYLNITYKREGKSLKTDQIVVTEGKLTREGYTFDAFFWKANPKVGGSVLDFAQKHLGLRNKIKTAEWLKTNILGEVEQKQAIPELDLRHDSFFELEYGLTNELCNKLNVGVPSAKTGIMKERMCFQLTVMGKHRGYIGFDYKGIYKTEWYTPKGTKTGDTLFNVDRFVGSNVCCILAQNPLDATILLSLGFPYVMGMLTPSLTEDQLIILKEFKRILVVSVNPDNIVNKLSKHCFVKGVSLPSLIGKTKDDITDLF